LKAIEIQKPSSKAKFPYGENTLSTARELLKREFEQALLIENK